MEISSLREAESEAVTKRYKEDFAVDVLTGLSAEEKRLSTKYFYDERGSDLFQKITMHEDYYLTRTEYNILNQVKGEIPKFIPESEIDLIELGAGDGHKSELLINGLLEMDKKVNYFPVDISKEAMNQLGEVMDHRPGLHIHGVIAEYLEGLRFLKEKSNNRKIVLFLGSNIGNFDKKHSEDFLRQLWKNLNNGDMILIGFDLKKDVDKLTAAYNDSNGYTRDFNLNLLDRINRELGGNFDKSKFQHHGVYNPRLGAMESYLLPIQDQKVYIRDLEREFKLKAYEPLHLEYSFKYSINDIANLCSATGYVLEKNFTDEKKLFIDSLWRVLK